MTTTTNVLIYQPHSTRICPEEVAETLVTCHIYSLYPFSLNQSINFHLDSTLSLNRELLFLTPGVALILS